MDEKKVTSLANLFRVSGDKILSSESTLTLSGSLVNDLNNSFSLITHESSIDHESDDDSEGNFKVVPHLNTKSDVLKDLLLIYDFVQKTLSLRITNYPEEEKGIIDLKNFRNLIKLEIQKLNVNQIAGIQKLRSQLRQLICIRCLKNIDDIIVYCGKDNSMGFAWKELRIADFSYNCLTKCDNSLEFTSYLESLNLSHNYLKSVEAIKWLPHLKNLDLSFNRLTSMPIFHTEANRKLKVLIINNNLIEDIGKFKLEALTDFDLSNNCLLDHSNLMSLSTLSSLNYLNLSGNPLFCHPKHRENTAKYLHADTLRVKFILDSEPLSKYEKSLTKKIISLRSIESVRLDLNNIGKKSESKKLPSCRMIDLEQSFDIAQLEDKNHSYEIKRKEERELDSKIKNVPTNKINLEDSKNEILAPIYNVSININTPISASTSENNSFINLEHEDILDVLPEKHNSSEGYQSDSKTKQSLYEIAYDEKHNSSEGYQSDSKTKQSLYESVYDSGIINSTYESKLEENVPKMLEYNASSCFEKEISEKQLVFENELVAENELVSETEEEEKCYEIAFVNDPEHKLILALSDTTIRERDHLTKRTMEKWNLKILESCDRIKPDTLRINFDTIKKDKKERVYKINESHCEELAQSLFKKILSNRSLLKVNQTIYNCIQCLTQFSREKSNKYEHNKECPECKSKYVAEVNESLDTTSNLLAKENKDLSKVPAVISFIENITTIFTPETKIKSINESQDVIKNTSNEEKLGEQITQCEKYVLEESNSHSSIGSAGSLNESSSCSKISQNSFDSNKSVAGSSSNERDNDFNNMGIDSSKYYNDSEVEILSNPSQSSIEVLDGFQQSRKTSEERRISRIPSLETIEDNSIRNFSFQYNSDNNTTIDLISEIPMINDNMKTITSKDSIGEFLKNEIKQTLAEKQKNNEEFSEGPEYNDKTNKPIMGIIEKKISIGHLNLTESSSSGSVTDSICTTYEQDSKSNDDLPISESGKENYSNDKKNLPFMSNIFKGLVQSTNNLMSKSQKSVDSDSLNVSENFKYNYNDFTDVDHRLKFYVINKFNTPKEFFKGLVKGKIFDGKNCRYYEAMVVMSTIKMYIIEIIGKETDNPSEWLKETFNVSIGSLDVLQLLPFKTGISISIRNFSEQFLLLLQDIARTTSLMLFFESNPLPSNCNLEYQVSEIVTRKLESLTKNNKVKMFTVLNLCELKNSDNEIELLSPTGFYMTDDHLYITKSNLSWLLENLENNVDLSSVQKMSNLVDVKKLESNILEIYFMDKRINRNESWKCEFETQENAETFLNAIEQSWQNTFGVPLLNN